MRGDSKATRIKRVRTVLSAFHKLSEKEAKNLLYFINDSGIQSLCEALYNSLYVPLDIANKDRKKLQALFLPRMKVLKKVARPQTPVQYKRKQLQKGAGIITALAGKYFAFFFFIFFNGSNLSNWLFPVSAAIIPAIIALANKR
jgi:hypothetical protein